MINRINLILQAKNITARQFAEEIGIQPSGMSHILGGRNNPSLDFVLKVIRRYPEIDANWLLLGKGEMYAAETVERPSHSSDMSPMPIETVAEESKPVADVPYAPSLFDDAESAVVEPEVKPYGEESSTEPSVAAEPVRREASADEPRYAPSYVAVPAEQVQQQSDVGTPRVVRMLLIYSDNTFSEYQPR